MSASVSSRESPGLRGRIETEFGLWGGRVCRRPWLVIGLMAAITLILAALAAGLVLSPAIVTLAARYQERAEGKIGRRPKSRS